MTTEQETHEGWRRNINPDRSFCWGQIWDYSNGRGGCVANPKAILLMRSREGVPAARIYDKSAGFSTFYDAVSGQKIRVSVTVVREATREEVLAARAEFRFSVRCHEHGVTACSACVQ